MKIFYSWQSDIDGKYNRNFILQALKNATKTIKHKCGYDVVIDQATRDEPGTPDIPNTILKKIDECSIFIADVTIINKNTRKRPTPNPNVLIELGYAIKKNGFEKIITITNNEYSKPEDLPFDIRHRKPLQYKYNDKIEKKSALKDFTNELENAIILINAKTLTTEKIDFILYNKEEAKPIGINCTAKNIFYKRITEDDFIKGLDFNAIKKYKSENKLNEWQEYLYKQVKKCEERKMAYSAMRGNTITAVGFVVDQYETENYYDKYMITALIRKNAIKIDFLAKNNNEQTMKNVKIVLKTKKNNKVRRKIDFPDFPASSTFAVNVISVSGKSNQSLFQMREYGEDITFEYKKDNLYATEEYIIEEPLYILCVEGLIEIGYTIYSDNLDPINGTLKIEIKSETMLLSPMEVFHKL